jgi:hypothetical protein
MSKPGALVAAAAAVLLLSSCAPSTTPSHAASGTPSPSVSQPAFLAAEQSDGDRLPDDLTTRVHVEAGTTRFQGQWEGQQIFLAVSDDHSVCLVSGRSGDADSWSSACGHGDEVVDRTLDDGGTIKYVPISTATTPEGWTRVSQFVFAM